MNYSSVNATHESVKYALWFAPRKSRKSLLLKILFQPLFPSSSLSLFPFLCSALQIFFSSKKPPNCYPFSSLSPSSKLLIFSLAPASFLFFFLFVPPSSRSPLLPFHFSFLSKLKPPPPSVTSLCLMSHLAATPQLFFFFLQPGLPREKGSPLVFFLKKCPKRELNSPPGPPIKGVYKYAPLW